MKTDGLWIVAVISNPVRYRSRYELYEAFAKRVERAGVNLLTVEMNLGERDFKVTNDINHRHIQLYGWDEIWHKENMINLGVQCLPSSWKYVAWIDADTKFVDDNWADNIVETLQHYEVAQLFQNAIDLGPKGEVHQKHNGFMWSWATGQPRGGSGTQYAHWHPGFAWAARREAWDNLGGLLDIGILGSGDHHMAWGLVGDVFERSPEGLSPGYRRALQTWQDRADARIRQDVGFMPGTILHFWHGKKADRRYADRWKILLKHNYDPDFDLQKDWQGVYMLSHRGERMRNDLRAYFRARHEDSIDL